MPINVGDGATVTMTMADFRRFENEIDALRKRLTESAVDHAAPIPIEAHDIFHALEAALPIVQFAVGNVPPESVRGWPAAELHTLASAVELLYAHNPDRVSLAVTFRQFARHCAQVDTYRAQRQAAAAEIAQTVLAEASSIENP